MEEYTKEEEQQEEETESTEIKRWFQDNLRIIVSIIIVIAIAGGIYSYSKRSESPSVTDESISTEKTTDDAAVTVEPGNASDSKTTDEKTTPATKTPTEVKQAAPESKETTASFVEVAGRGDSKTVLARRALANYLEKNPDSALTKEHKIYIEDYLRKQTPSKGVAIGSSLEFSKDAIAKAIELSKNLSAKQLKNLEKYSARVTSI
jgi:type IV secretory pathway VirB10-like protein